MTVATSFCADYCACYFRALLYSSYFCCCIVVASIEDTAEKYEIPRQFIGIILLPIVVCPHSFCHEPIALKGDGIALGKRR